MDEWKIRDVTCYRGAITIKKETVIIRLGTCGTEEERIEITHKTDNAIRLTFYYIVNATQKWRSTWFPKKIIMIHEEFITMPAWLAKKENWI